MNHYPPGAQAPPALPYHPNRRQSDYHYPRPTGTPPQPHMPYPAYHHPQYHGPTPMQYQQQWYPAYQYHPHPPQQLYQPRSPLVVSSQLPNVQPTPQGPRAPVYTPIQTPKPVPTPQPDQSTTPSTGSQQVLSPDTPSTSLNAPTPPAIVSRPNLPPLPPPAPATRMPYYPELPWYSDPDSSFPARAPRIRRKRENRQSPAGTLELPARQQDEDVEAEEATNQVPKDAASPPQAEPSPSLLPATVASPGVPESSQSPVPSTSMPPPQTKLHVRNPTLPIVPIVPIIPAIPKSSSQRHTPVSSTATGLPGPAVTSQAEDATPDTKTTTPPPGERPSSVSSPIKATPKSWADLVRSNAPTSSATPSVNANGGNTPVNGIVLPKSASISDALRLYNVEYTGKVSFLEPRGLINTGNMCYMNSILQILVFCVPFYEFLDQIGKRAVHNFKSDTPMIEAMIMFMREYNIIDSAVTVEQLRMRLKDSELEQYGEAFIPEYVYDVIRKLPKFSNMRRGHQQDAEEFLGFLLEELHDECVHLMQSLSYDQPSGSSTSTQSLQSENTSTDPTTNPTEGGWLEVGPKQKPSVTRSSGAISTDSPVTKIFGGTRRSELRVPGLKNSVTLQPYQALQLDIGAPDIFTIVDALKGLTKPETLNGDFNSPRGPGSKATMQVFIESLPPVLILHLKRFHYDNTGGAQKIWKKVGYPLELEIPKEVFPQSKRAGLALKPGGLPSYRLIGVVYHHGKNASGGHYTVDVRRQDGKEWIRLDDTVIRRVRSEEVASEGGEDSKALAAALEKHKRAQSVGKPSSKAALGDEGEEKENGDGWSHVNGNPTSPGATTTKKWSNVANGNGSSTPSTAGMKTPKDRFSVKDNKVAYILFYQQIKT